MISAGPPSAVAAASSCTVSMQARTKAGFRTEILRRIARNEQLRENDDVRALVARVVPRRTSHGGVAGQVADDRV